MALLPIDMTDQGGGGSTTDGKGGGDAESSSAVNGSYHALLCHQSDRGDVYAQRIRFLRKDNTKYNYSQAFNEMLSPVQIEYVMVVCNNRL